MCKIMCLEEEIETICEVLSSARVNYDMDADDNLLIREESYDSFESVMNANGFEFEKF